MAPSERHWVIVGAGTAGCVLANRLSQRPDRQVTLIEAGPDLVPHQIAPALSGPSFFDTEHEPGRGYPNLLARRTPDMAPQLYRRGRGVGGSSVVNAMVALRGDADQYRSWGWTDVDEAWERVLVPEVPACPDELGAVDRALLTADDRAHQVPLTRGAGKRISSAEAYLWPVLDRPNLTVLADSPVERIVVADRRAVGVRVATGEMVDADHVVVAAGAIHTPTLLLRSGVDTNGIGDNLQDHPAAVLTLALRNGVEQDVHGLAVGSALHATVDGALLQLLPLNHLGQGTDRAGLGALMAAVMSPRSAAGTVRIDAAGEPLIDFALLDHPDDRAALLHAVKLALRVLRAPSFTQIVERIFIDDQGTTVDALDSDAAVAHWLSAHCADYVHASGTCAMGSVIDQDFGVRGYRDLYVCDASVFPVIPLANTHLPTTMVAERFALRHE